jgi:hypothetical protein
MQSAKKTASRALRILGMPPPDLRTLNPEVVSSRKLDLFVYQCFANGQIPASAIPKRSTG